MGGRRHWVARTGVGAATAALLVAGLTTAAMGGETPSAHRAAPAPGRTSGGTAGAAGATGVTSGGAGAAGGPASGRAGAAAEALSPMGAFTESGEQGVQNLAGLQEWLGGTPVRVGHTYLAGDSWDSIEAGGDLLEPWARWKHAASGRLFVLNVPMQEHNEEHVSDDQVRGLIQAGAQGANDAHFTRLAQRLVALGVPDTVIVLGWEMNGSTYTHRCGPDPDGWKTYWNRIVAAMRAVPGQHFRFDFAPNRGQDAIAWTQCYPGDASVDIVGMDSYDQPGGETFYEQVTEPYGLQAQVDFAAAHKKAISYPEWGLFRNGDNPDYMALMLSWISTHRPMYQTVTDYCPHGVWQCQENPRASAVYRALMSRRKTAVPSAKPAASATTTPSPTSPTTTPAPAATPSATAAPATAAASPATAPPATAGDTTVTADPSGAAPASDPAGSSAPASDTTRSPAATPPQDSGS